MKKLFAIGLLGLFAAGCGDAGLGFNIGTVFPLTIPVDLGDFPAVPVVDPPAITKSDTYSLSDVDDFSDDFDKITDVLLKGIQYEIINVDPNEQIQVQQMLLEFSSEDTPLGTLDITDQLPTGNLQNVTKTEITTLDLDEIARLLDPKTQNQDIQINVVLDFGEFPDPGFEFDFVFHFDVVVKVRDL